MIDPITAETMGGSYAAMLMRNGRALRNAVVPETAKQVIGDIARANGIKPTDIIRYNRERRFAWPRQEVMRVLYRDLGLSMPQIGRLLGRDHTTVLHGIRQAEKRLAEK